MENQTRAVQEVIQLFPRKKARFRPGMENQTRAVQEVMQPDAQPALCVDDFTSIDASPASQVPLTESPTATGPGVPSAFIPPRHVLPSGPMQGTIPVLLALASSQHQVRSHPQTPQNQGERKKRGPVVGGTKLKAKDYALILDYLEIRENFNAIHGAGRKTKIGGRFQSKKLVFASMAAMLAEYGFPKMDGGNLSKRFGRYVDMYRKAVMFKNSDGGLTEEELQSGMTLESKLEKMCTHFKRMHHIYGKSVDAQPLVTVTLGFRRNSGVAEVPKDLEEGVEDSENDEEEEPPSPPPWRRPEAPKELEEDAEDSENDEQEPPSPTWHMSEDEFVVQCEDEHLQTERPAEYTHSTEMEEVRPEQNTIQSQHEQPSPILTGPSNIEGPQPSQGGVEANITSAQGVVPPAVRVDSTSKGQEKSEPIFLRSSPQGSDTSKDNLAALYSEKHREKIKFRKELISNKTQWKQDDSAKIESAKREKLDRIRKFKLEQFSAAQAEKRQRLDHQHQMIMGAQMIMKAQLLLGLIRDNKSEEEIARSMKLVEPYLPQHSPQSNDE